MLTEDFITSTRAQPKAPNTAIAKDVGIFLHTLNPTHNVRSTFKKSSTAVNNLAISSTHIFAAQAEKAVIHVYARDTGKQEALISFPERIHSLAIVDDGLVMLGTAEGRVVLWEVCTGRQVSTPPSHLQPVSCLAATSQHLLSGSEDSNIHVWSIPRLISLTSTDAHEPLRTLPNHRAAISSLVLGHSSTNTNICISASKDSTCIVWNYHSGHLLRTFLLISTPLCITLDPCDRAFYVALEDGSIQSIDLYQPTSVENTLYDSSLQSTPVQVTTEPFVGALPDVGQALCLGLSYDGTALLSGHSSGKVIRWEAGPQKFSAELVDLNAPVTNITMLSPFPKHPLVKAVAVVKPRLGEGQYTLTGQFVDSLGTNDFESAVYSVGIPQDMLEAAIMEFSTPNQTTSTADDQLRKENEDLWAIINEQRALQKRTYDKYIEAKGGR